jgi:TonB family protein
MLRHTLVHVGVALLLFPIAARATDPEQSLRGQYQGKIFILRDCRPGQKLLYDSGDGLDGTTVGEWTTDGFIRVDEIHLSANSVGIKATRQVVVSAGQGFQFAAEKIARKTKNHGVVEIEVRFNKGNFTEAAAMLSKIFLTSRESFIDFVPNYWKTCIKDGLSGKNASCRFSSEIAAVPGLTNQTPTAMPTRDDDSSRNSTMRSNGTAANLGATIRVGGPVKPPRVVHQPEPQYSEFARKTGIHGIVTLGLVINKDGVPEEVQIVGPLGAGLDAKAVQAVERWKFQPAQKDGQPLAVRIAVEVDFHLY